MKKYLLLICTIILIYSGLQSQNILPDNLDFYGQNPEKYKNLIKSVEKELVFIPNASYKNNDSVIEAGNFYIDVFETSNQMYSLFLNDLKDNKLIDLYNIAKVDSAKWMQLSEAYETAAKFYHSSPTYSNYPVVNISYEAANLYCSWLTKIYNKCPSAKFKNVEFKLPTKKQWIVAAMGGQEASIYPWQGKFLKNQKGELLCNFKVAGEENIWINPESGKAEIRTDNILYQTSLVPIKSYQPNSYKIYQLSGNAAEMLNEPGKTKGGSWNSYGYYMQINSDEDTENSIYPNPFTGFRIIMIVK